MELLMLCHDFFFEETVFFELLYTGFLFAKSTSFLCYFSSGKRLRKKTSNPGSGRRYWMARKMSKDLSRALWHWYNLRTRCQEILGRSAVAVTDWKYTSYDLIFIANGWLTWVMTWVGLPMSTNWKDTSYDLIHFVVNRLVVQIGYCDRFVC